MGDNLLFFPQTSNHDWLHSSTIKDEDIIVKKKYLTRSDAAGYLTNIGLPVAKNTLQKLASIGGGPLYALFGNRALYRPRDLDDWAEGRLSKPRHSTTEGAEL